MARKRKTAVADDLLKEGRGPLEGFKTVGGASEHTYVMVTDAEGYIGRLIPRVLLPRETPMYRLVYDDGYRPRLVPDTRRFTPGRLMDRKLPDHERYDVTRDPRTTVLPETGRSMVEEGTYVDDVYGYLGIRT